jgi:ubiquinone/menaquinone biosynthesis C-methylase UbiE
MENHDDQVFWQRAAKHDRSVMKRSSAALYQEICDQIRPELKRDMNVLELACGTGQLSFPLSSRVRLWEATDASPAMIAQAKAENYSVRLHFSVQDATQLPYGPETFDAVVISNALHIMPHPEQALAESRRVLKPGGILFAPTFVQGEKGGHGLRIRLLEQMGFRTYHRWNTRELSEFLVENGFQVKQCTTFHGGLAPLCYISAERLPLHAVDHGQSCFENGRERI